MKYLWHRDIEYILHYTANQWQGEGSNQSNLHAPRAQALDHSAACPPLPQSLPKEGQSDKTETRVGSGQDKEKWPVSLDLASTNKLLNSPQLHPDLLRASEVSEASLDWL